MKYLTQDLTKIEYGVIAHGCNAQGVMGAGVAKALRNKWPEVYTEYCKMGLELGRVQYVCIDDLLFVANCITQEYYGNDNRVYASLKAIDSALSKVAKDAGEFDLPIFMPKIGCGLGGLAWSQVAEIVSKNEKIYGAEFNICDLTRM